MIKAVTKTMWQTEDGLQFESRLEAEAHECVCTMEKVLRQCTVNWEDCSMKEIAREIYRLGYELKRIDPQAP